MRPIPLKLRERMESDPEMHVCIYSHFPHGFPFTQVNDCMDEFGNRPGRAEWEHAFIYAGKQINEWWAIIGVCWFHHRGPGLNKDYNKYRALMRMSEKDFDEAQIKYPKDDWRKISLKLINKFENLND